MSTRPPPHLRRGTSKIVPVVVSAGLAVGVFCGLLFGLGTGKPGDAVAGVSSTSDDAMAAAIRAAVEQARDRSAAVRPVETSAGSGTAVVAEPGAGSDGGSGSGSAVATVVDAGSGSGSASGSGSGSGSGAGSASGSPATVDATKLGSGSGSAAATPQVRNVVLTFDVTPAGAAISVDKVKVAGPSLTVALDGASKRVRVEASASGYRSYDESVDVSADQVIKIRMTKRKKAPPGGGLMEPD